MMAATTTDTQETYELNYDSPQHFQFKEDLSQQFWEDYAGLYGSFFSLSNRNSSDQLLLKQILFPSNQNERTPCRGNQCTVHLVIWTNTSEPQIAFSTREKVSNKFVGGVDEPLTFTLLQQTPVPPNQFNLQVKQTIHNKCIHNDDDDNNEEDSNEDNDEEEDVVQLRDSYEWYTFGRMDIENWFPPGIHIAIATMHIGERSMFCISPYLVYQERGDEGKIGANCSIFVDIELLSVDTQILAPVPPRSIVEQTRLQREQIEKQEYLAHRTIDWTSRIAQAKSLRTQGNEHMRAQEYTKAKGLYGQAFASLLITSDDAKWDTTIQDTQLQNEIATEKGVLHLNRCLTNIQLKQWQDAEWDAKHALLYRPHDTKALYRRGYVRLARLQQETHFFDDSTSDTSSSYWDPEISFVQLFKAKWELFAAAELAEPPISCIDHNSIEQDDDELEYASDTERIQPSIVTGSISAAWQHVIDTFQQSCNTFVTKKYQRNDADHTKTNHVFNQGNNGAADTKTDHVLGHGNNGTVDTNKNQVFDKRTIFQTPTKRLLAITQYKSIPSTIMKRLYEIAHMEQYLLKEMKVYTSQQRKMFRGTLLQTPPCTDGNTETKSSISRQQNPIDTTVSSKDDSFPDLPDLID